MVRDAIFYALPAAALAETSRYLSFNTIVSTTPTTWFCNLDPAAQAAWLDKNREKLEDEFCGVGSWTFGSTRTYGEIVRDLAQKMSLSCPSGSDTPDIERAILTKVWNDAVAKLTPEQLATLKVQTEELASKYGRTLGMEMTGFAALSAAQISGFGVYLLGSTVLGAINGVLGLGLSFGAFTGLSSLISMVIGPVGWAALGLATIVKLGAPNYKKVLPVVILIATNRPLISENVTSSSLARAQVSNYLQSDAFRQAVANAAKVGSSAQNAPEPVTSNSGLDDETPGPAITEHIQSETPRLAQETIQAVQRDIDICTELARPKRSPLEGLHRKATRQERVILTLRNPEICRAAAELGFDYFEMSPGDQTVVQDIVRERKAFTDPQPEATNGGRTKGVKNKPDAVPPNPLVEDKDDGREDHRLKQRVKKTRAEFRFTLHTLEFKDDALERYCGLPFQDALLFLSEFSRMNRGDLDGEHDVPRTSPKVFQRSAGSAGRVYYRQQGGPAPVLIERIGDKRTQDSDYVALRRAKR